MSLSFSEDTAHTVEVTREVNERGELGSFGFTLNYEKPPIVGTIVPGEIELPVCVTAHLIVVLGCVV